MSIQTGATIETRPTKELETDDYDITGNDYGEIPIVHENTVLTDGIAIHARKQALTHSQEKLDNADITTKRDAINRHKERVNDFKNSHVISLPTTVTGEKRDIINIHVEPSVSNVDERLLSAILYASTHEHVTDITTTNKVVTFNLTNDTHIEATKLGDGIVIQGRSTHNGHAVCRTFPETCLQENDVLTTLQDLLAPDNGWAIF